MQSTPVTEGKKRRGRKEKEQGPLLSERDQRLILGFLSAYMIDTQKMLDGIKAVIVVAPDLEQFQKQKTRAENIISALKQMGVRAQQKQWWLAGKTPEEIERMDI